MAYKISGKIKYSSTPVKDGFILRLGENSNETYYGIGIAIDSSKNIYAVGSVSGKETLVIKCNPSGRILWQRKINESSNNRLDRGYSIAVSPVAPNNIHIVGAAATAGSNNLYYSSLNKDTGEPVTSNVIRGAYSIQGNSIGIGSTGQVYMAGSASDGTDNSVCIIKGSGTIQWQRTLSSLGDDDGNGIAVYSYNNTDDIYIIGRHPTIGSFSDVLVAKYNSSGVLQWQKSWGNDGTNRQIGNSIGIGTTGSVYAFGWGFGGGFGGAGNSYILAKFNSSGDIIWQKKLVAQSPAVNHEGTSVCVDNLENIYVVGSADTVNDGVTPKDFFMAKYNSSGDVQWARRLSTAGIDIPRSITVDDNHIYIVGETGKIGSAAGSQISDSFAVDGKFTIIKLPSDGTGIGTYTMVGIGTYSTYTYSSIGYTDTSITFTVGVSTLTDAASTFTTATTDRSNTRSEYYYTNISIP
jgi:hypothetical protein